MPCCATATACQTVGVISSLSGLAAPWYNSVTFNTPVIASGATAAATQTQAQNVAAATTPIGIASINTIMPLLFLGLVIVGIVLIMRSR
jgi:predicted P-loop ATPase/GTPase